MIQLDFRNILKGKIGAGNGLDERFFEKAVVSSQKWVKSVLDSKEKEGYAFLSLPEDKKSVAEIEAFARRNRSWENIVVIGIGGSSLGGIALEDSLLGPWHNLLKKPRLFFTDNVDPDWFLTLLDSLDLKKTLFVVVSKSGGTSEPMALYAVVRERLERKLGKAARNHWVFVTDPKSGILRKMGQEEGIPMFGIPPKVGGRFSVLSAAALLPAAMAGIPIKQILAGASAMKRTIAKERGLKNPALALACAQFMMDTGKRKPMVVMMPYSNLLYRVADWYRQLLAESIGKNPKTGPTPINALGTTDQHSQIQLYNAGPRDKWILFLKVGKHGQDAKIGKGVPHELDFLKNRTLGQVLAASLEGTAESLAKNGRPNATLTLDRISPESVGALLFLLEFQVALLGLMYDVNAFDQPGVEEGKKITKQILSKPASSKK